MSLNIKLLLNIRTKTIKNKCKNAEIDEQEQNIVYFYNNILYTTTCLYVFLYALLF